jgi:hypothetical protein
MSRLVVLAPTFTRRFVQVDETTGARSSFYFLFGMNTFVETAGVSEDVSFTSYALYAGYVIVLESY